MQHEVTIDKLVHGGQGIGTLADGKKALVWNVLPGETVRFMARRSKSSYVEGIADEIITASPEREVPRDDLYLSTSPWQMMQYDAENRYKQEILAESLQRANVPYESKLEFSYPEAQWHYRNKMEYSFYGDDDGLHLALFNRGTHQKQPVEGSSIARPEIDTTARAIRDVLASAGVRAGDIKSLVVRCNRAGDCVAALFTRNENLQELPFADICKGVAVYFSNPRSPASVLTRELYVQGDITLTDDLRGKSITYDVVSFFQVNLDAYDMALSQIASAVGERPVTDMYAGVGSIGLSIAAQPPRLIELDSKSAAMARLNGGEVIESASEKATQYIPSGLDQTVIFDPPRAGLHSDVTAATLDALPGQIVYLSCNPSTFARDLELLSTSYSIQSITGFNFFPRTPHIEALAVLQLSSVQ